MKVVGEYMMVMGEYMMVVGSYLFTSIELVQVSYIV